MSTKYVQPGEVMEVTLAGTVTADDVDVVGTALLGVALGSGVSGEKISYAVRGVYKIPKATAAVITQGQQVLWDVSAGNVDDDQATPAAGDFLCGYATESAGNGDTEVEVAINERAAAVT
jgi:predicted RecA/RadA family phage recombinase